MKFMPINKRNKPSGVAAIRAEIEKLDADRLAAETEWARLRDGREVVLLDGEDADLRVHDEEMARLSREAERCVARAAALQVDLAAAEAQAEQDRRRAAYNAAKAAQAKGRALLRQYPEKARALASPINELSEAEFMIVRANQELPDGVEPLDTAEPFNGRHPTEREFAPLTRLAYFSKITGQEVNGFNPADPTIEARQIVDATRTTITRDASPGSPHTPLAQRVRIPQIDPNAPRFW